MTVAQRVWTAWLSDFDRSLDPRVPILGMTIKWTIAGTLVVGTVASAILFTTHLAFGWPGDMLKAIKCAYGVSALVFLPAFLRDD